MFQKNGKTSATYQLFIKMNLCSPYAVRHMTQKCKHCICTIYCYIHKLIKLLNYSAYPVHCVLFITEYQHYALRIRLFYSAHILSIAHFL
jgi:hypothetical protein